MDKAAYLQLLERKLPTAERAGITPPSPCHESLKPHQREICEWAIRGGRRAIFAQFGLGKTRMHLQIAQWVVQFSRGAHLSSEMPPALGGTRGKFLIVAPLGVRQEFISNDGPAMGLEVQYVRTMAEAEAAEADILITNYERVRDGDIDPRNFAGAGLDEASVLRSFGSETYQKFLRKFEGLRFRYVFTATPSPNQYRELINYGGFLGVMDTGQALTRFFQRNSSTANDLTLMPHMEGQFWHWLRSWSVFIESPADLGHDATGYDLPQLTVHWHRIEIDHRKNWAVEKKDGGELKKELNADSWGQAHLFADDAEGLQKAAATKRDSISLRVSEARELMKSIGKRDGKKRRWLLWHDLEAERAAIEAEIPKAVTVWGSQDMEQREAAIADFANGKIDILATKPIIAGSGCNFQRHCSDAIFLGVGYKFNDLIQAIHRIQRFQQTHPVHIHIIHLDTEDRVVEALKAKWRRHEELVSRMTALLREHRLGLSTDDILRRTLGVNREERNSTNQPIAA